MTRLQKKCFAASLGMHSLLLIILIASSAFRSKPVHKDIPLVITMVNLPVTDDAGVGGGSPQAPAPPAAQQQPQPAPQVQPAPPRMTVTPSPAPPKNVEAPQPVRHREPTPEPEVQPEPDNSDNSEHSILPASKPHKQHRDIKPTFDEATPTTHSRTKKHPKPVEENQSESDSAAEQAAAAATRASRTRSRVSDILASLATGVQTSGAAGTVVDMPGQGGGQAFIGYETYIYNAYYRAWVPPDSVANKLANVDVRIVVSRDGSILSSEIENRSGDRELDRSVEKALRAVTHLPEFPKGATDERRTFLLRFNVEAKEGSG